MAWGGCGGVGGGYGATRPGCALYGEKIPRTGDVFPGKCPFRPSARDDFRPDKIKAPEEYPGAHIWVID